MLDVKLYQGIEKSTWCPGCGDFGILRACQMALASLDLYPHQVLFVSGIGCGSKLPHYLWANGYNGTHGRPLPIATGAHLANHELKVIVTDGDGDAFGIGGNHMLHSMRRNADLCHVVENNQVYGLTKGQYSPTSDLGFITTTSPEGTIEMAVNAVAVGLAAGATFIARGFSGDVKELANLIAEGIKHRGYSIVDVLQPCVIYGPDKMKTYDLYKGRTYSVSDESDYDPTDRRKAWEKGQEWGERIPVGIIYRDEGRPTFEDQVPALLEGPLVHQPLNEKVVKDWDNLLETFM